MNNQNNLLNTPYISNEVYEFLPDFLKRSTDQFKDAREKDVFLLSTLGVLSSCLPNVNGSYGDNIYYPNLYLLILAPAASGKSKLKFAAKLVEHYDTAIKMVTKSELDEYRRKLKEYKSTPNNSNLDKPEQPKLKSFIIPADSSSTRFLEMLSNNGGAGLVVETEADTLGNTLAKDWGSYSDALRKGFEHEKISVSRLRDNIFIEINEPKLSVVLTGTPNQVVNIMSSAENGLASRFCYYNFTTERFWKSQLKGRDAHSIHAHFEEQSEEVTNLIHFFQKKGFEFSFTQEQITLFDRQFEKIFSQVKNEFNEIADSFVFRMGPIALKIGMILSAIRLYETRSRVNEWNCHPHDFIIVQSIANTLIQHGLITFQNLPSPSSPSLKNLPDYMLRLFSALERQFTRSELIGLAKKENISQRTIDHNIKKSKDAGIINTISPGVFEKNYDDNISNSQS